LTIFGVDDLLLRSVIIEVDRGVVWSPKHWWSTEPSAITEVGIVGNWLNNSPTAGSNGSNADGPLTRTYFGGDPEAIARATVSREVPNRRAIARCDKPSLPCRYRISAQVSKLITYPIVARWPIFKERQWPGFQGASTRVPPTLMAHARDGARSYGKFDLIDASTVAHAALRKQTCPRCTSTVRPERSDCCPATARTRR
jgi:hypothetical protein